MTDYITEGTYAAQDARDAVRLNLTVREVTEKFPEWLGFPVSGDSLTVHRVIRDAAVRQTAASFGLVDR